MKTVGITAEYNPFHSGHAYQLGEAKKASGADAAVVVMSGAVVQRGMPASFGKRFRAASAVESGADLVLELPYVYSGQSAEGFAQGAVKTLLEAGVDAISFGAETADADLLRDAAKILADEPEEFKEALANGLKEGLSYPAARQMALGAVSEEAAKVLDSPNNILGVEYLKALIQQGEGDLEAFPIQRVASDYHGLDLDRAHASATAIRQALHDDDPDSIRSFIPNRKKRRERRHEKRMESRKIFDDTARIEEEYLRFHPDDFLAAVKLRLAMEDPDELELYPGMGQGLADRLNAMVRSGELYRIDHLEELYTALDCKQFTRAAVNRALLALVLNITKNDVRAFTQPYYEPYLRVLAMNDKGREIVKQLRADGKRVICTPSIDRKDLDRLQSRAWELEERALRLQDLFMEEARDPEFENDFGSGSMMRAVPVVISDEPES